MVALKKQKQQPQPVRLTYRDAGVDVDAGDAFVQAIAPAALSTAGNARPGSTTGFGKGYGALFDLKAAGYIDPVLVSSTDGVGTKLRIAIDTNALNTVGIDLVAMCVNDILCRGAEPLYFLDYFACGKLDEHQGRRIVEGIAEGCRQAGVALIGGETAEMPDFYAEKDFDLAGFAVGAVERTHVLPSKSNIKPGDKLIGVASSGVHSNGYSFVRRVVAEAGLKWSDPAPFAGDRTLGEALLTPTKIYVQSLLPILKKGSIVKSLAHITGSGHVGKLHRIIPEAASAHVDLTSWTVPPVFRWLRDMSGLTTEDDERTELLGTFNCGIGMVAIVGEDRADEMIRDVRAAGEEAFVIGRIEARKDRPVVFGGRLQF